MSNEEIQRHLDRDWFKRHGFIRQDNDEFKSTVTFQDVAVAAFKDGLANRKSPSQKASTKSDEEIKAKAKAYATPPDGWVPVDNWIEIRDVERARRDAYYAGYKSCMSDLALTLTTDDVTEREWTILKNPPLKMVQQLEYEERILELEEKLSKLLWHVTGGLVSKPEYTLESMVEAFEQYLERRDERLNQGRELE